MNTSADTIKYNAFLKKVSQDPLKVFYTNILVLDKNDKITDSINGEVTGGSISISSSPVRRSGSISFVTNSMDNSLVSINDVLSISKKIKILIGIENHVDDNFEDIVWFNQGIYVITQISISHSVNNISINLSIQDKICLLNGDFGGTIPAEAEFDTYNQIIGHRKTYKKFDDFDDSDIENLNDYTIYEFNNSVFKRWNIKEGWIDSNKDAIGTIEIRSQKLYDVIQTAVCNYGHEDISKIFIYDIPYEIKQITRWCYTSNNVEDNTEDDEDENEDLGYLYYDSSIPRGDSNSKRYYLWNDPEIKYINKNNLVKINSGRACGYSLIEFCYPHESDKDGLKTGVDANVVTLLNKITSYFSNYEYFYDIDGNFIFREKRNYLNSNYDPIINLSEVEKKIMGYDNCYFVDFSGNPESVYSFDEECGLLVSCADTPDFKNVKNDFHVWGKKNNDFIHYHLAIKDKPYNFNTWYVEDIYENGEKTGRIKLVDDQLGEYSFTDSGKAYIQDSSSLYNGQQNKIFLNDSHDTKYSYDDKTKIIRINSTIRTYVATDWRAELYLRGLYKIQIGQRPDLYEQEILDYFDTIYDMSEQKYKVDIDDPFRLGYWIDFIEPIGKFSSISVDVIGPRTKVVQEEKIGMMYNDGCIQNVVMINKDLSSQEQERQVKYCKDHQYDYTFVSNDIATNFVYTVAGYSAEDYMRELLYQYTSLLEAVNLTIIPIYYLEPNTKIDIKDSLLGLYGDYIVGNISVPLDAKSNMTINATKALKRI